VSSYQLFTSTPHINTSTPHIITNTSHQHANTLHQHVINTSRQQKGGDQPPHHHVNQTGNKTGASHPHQPKSGGGAVKLPSWVLSCAGSSRDVGMGDDRFLCEIFIFRRGGGVSTCMCGRENRVTAPSKQPYSLPARSFACSWAIKHCTRTVRAHT